MIAKQLSSLLCSAALCLCSLQAVAAAPGLIEWRGEATVNASSGDFAPYMIGSWNYGKVTGADGVWLDGLVRRKMDYGERFSWGAGLECLFGYGSAAGYDFYHDGVVSRRSRRQAPARIQQIYTEVKYRSLFLIAGMKERQSAGIVDDALSSGDITRSTNARPIPGVAAGFTGFQNIPFTGGWLQIDGEIMYGKFTDSKYRRQTFNYRDGVLSYDNWYTYKRCHFRTRPSEPLCVTIGMQAAGEFAGKAFGYVRGEISYEYLRKFRFRDIFDMFWPREGSGEEYYKGNSLGSWDFKTRYRFRNGSELAFYFEGPWEDGSGIGRKNGWDGLWGVQYNFARSGAVSKIVVEYFDFTNQSGPLHWAPGDSPGTDITSQATGGDNYYNNEFYGPYSNYGMSIGSPFVVSPLYNSNGSPGYIHNRARGIHAAAEGLLGTAWAYKAAFSRQQAGGSGRIPAPRKQHDTSAMVQILWTHAASVSGLSLKAQAAFDAGSLRGDNFGAMVGIAYTGNLNIRK